MEKTLELLEETERARRKGPGDAPVTLTEYGDFQCPACGQMFEVLRQIELDLGPRLDWVFKHFPLKTIHPRAQAAAQAAEAAAAQDRFWEMHDRLFTHQSDLRPEALQKYAEEIPLDLDRFNADFSKADTLARIDRDINQGLLNGVTHTPTFFINGERYTGPLSYQGLRRALEEALRHPRTLEQEAPRRRAVGHPRRSNN
jgi:protein-disulfide isomerase